MISSEPDWSHRDGRVPAVMGTITWLLIAPGVVAVFIPWSITGWETANELASLLRAIGALSAGLGVATLLDSFARFALEGRGTPAPIVPTPRLVVGGLYRQVRNPSTSRCSH